MKPSTEFATREALMQAAVSRVAQALNQAIAERGEACAALSGGGTPEPAYRALAVQPLDWQRITFLLVDERFVPPTHEASNENMLRRALDPALSAGATLAPMFTEGATLEAAASRADVLYACKQIDVAVMGMGGDGHTASWFPQSPQLKTALDPAEPRTVISINAPGAAGSAQRLTLTRSAISRASEIILLITGAEKRALLTAEQREHLPVDALFEGPTRVQTLWAR